ELRAGVGPALGKLAGMVASRAGVGARLSRLAYVVAVLEQHLTAGPPAGAGFESDRKKQPAVGVGRGLLQVLQPVGEAAKKVAVAVARDQRGATRIPLRHQVLALAQRPDLHLEEVGEVGFELDLEDGAHRLVSE